MHFVRSSRYDFCIGHRNAVLSLSLERTLPDLSILTFRIPLHFLISISQFLDLRTLLFPSLPLTDVESWMGVRSQMDAMIHCADLPEALDRHAEELE